MDNPSILQIGDSSVVSPSAPPNYEELDSPPAYAILFPAQKTSESMTTDTISRQEQFTRNDNEQNNQGNSSNSQHL